MMTYAVLAVLMALQIGQGCPNVMWYQTNPPMYGECEISIPDAEPIPVCSVPEHGWDTTCGAMMKFCRLLSPRPRPQDLMPLVEPLRPLCVEKDSFFCGEPPMEVTPSPDLEVRRRVSLSVVPAIQKIASEEELPITFNCVDGWIQNVLYGPHCATRKYWACTDPKRVLLSSEDGSGHWCVRF